MPLNDGKIISIILEQCNEIEERCDGYKDTIIDVIVDVLENERSHRISATNIQKKINDKCASAARFLANKRSHTTGTEKLVS